MKEQGQVVRSVLASVSCLAARFYKSDFAITIQQAHTDKTLTTMH